MKAISSILFVLFLNNAFGQFAVIKDNDGYVNIRTEASKGNNISDKLNNGFVVYCFEPKNNWINIDYSKNNKDRSGYLHKDRIQYLSEFTEIPLIKETQTKVVFEKDGFNISIESKKFELNLAKLIFSGKDKSFLKEINGKSFWGTDGEIPKKAYKSITVTLGNNSIELPKNSFDDLFEPTLFKTQINYDQKSDTLYITSSNSDGAGGYEIIWIIEKGKYKERKIAYGF
ncbi:hypothetical protein [Flavobacterium quisquiliarum]|uniref:SH3 domain-containing protein n=1 Tax=Flavobacterium quisquiliarum TaxID=1834436 RepID=A0ABV8WCI1_9FLAO|nr:hypothetical protein [Flavobacterium quisquiliarum]MBW1654059.1 hypothetical protein [Flavobacterium quisquiliarum]NWL04180.1 hypothetical protein [Flavobacterium collinsii]